MDEILYQIKCYLSLPFILMYGGITGGYQNIDGYYYYPKEMNPPELIKIAREKDWGTSDLLLATYPKSGTHFGMLTSLLVLYKGEFPSKADLHSLCYAPEFSVEGENCLSLGDPSPTQPVGVYGSHMPQHHVKYSETGKYLYIMRDSVATLASLRRMDQLMYGSIICPSLSEFVKFHLHTRETGWLGNF
jgi:hypothetical protein